MMSDLKSLEFLPLFAKDTDLYPEITDLIDWAMGQSQDILETVTNRYLDPSQLELDAIKSIIGEFGFDYVADLAEQLRVRVDAPLIPGPATIQLDQFPVNPGSVNVYDSLNRTTIYGVDDGNGNIVGPFIFGTIDYESGVLEVSTTTVNNIQVIYETDSALNAVISYLPFIALYKGSRKGAELILNLLDITYDIVEHWEYNKDRSKEDGTNIKIDEFKINIPVDDNEIARLMRLFPSLVCFFENYVYPQLYINLAIEDDHTIVLPATGYHHLCDSGEYVGDWLQLINSSINLVMPSSGFPSIEVSGSVEDSL